MRKNLKFILAFVFFVQAIACLAVAVVLLLKKKYTASAIVGAVSAAGIFGGTVMLVRGRREKALVDILEDDDFGDFEEEEIPEEEIEDLEIENV